MATTVDLSVALSALLERIQSFSWIAQAFHWNTVGSDFTEFHQLFGGIYEAAYAPIDDLAEAIRRLGGFAPQQVGPIGLEGSLVTEPVAQVEALAVANDGVLADVVTAAVVAGGLNEFGIQNLLGDIQFAHEKVRWMLSAHLS